MWSRLAGSLGLALAAVAMCGVGTSYGDSVAITGGATSVTNTSAALNGAINAGAQDVGWTFQYWSTPPPLRQTGVVSAGPGLFAVSQTISGLTPGTAYHFRLAGVARASTTLAAVFFTGELFTFTTTDFGKTKLVHRRLKVKRGMVSMPFACVGGQGLRCQGTVSLSTVVKVGRNRRTVGCASASFAGSSGRTQTARARFGSRCAALLGAAPRRSISATLVASFSTQPGGLKQGVTLSG